MAPGARAPLALPRYTTAHFRNKVSPLSPLFVDEFAEFDNVDKEDFQLFIQNISFKGVLHPRQMLWLFVHFSQKLQLIGDK